jgi:hypothetical protein
MQDNAEIQEKIKELVIARLRSAPPHLGIAIGSQETYTPEEIINEINNGTKLGEEYMDLEMEFLRALKEGALYGQNSSV